MSVFSVVARMIEEALARWNVPAGQISGQLPGTVLPPTGNTGAGYTPASHTHPPDAIEQAGANLGDVLTWDGSEWAPAPPTGGGGAVDSVNGQTGTVVLDAADVGAAAASHTHTASDVTDFSEAVDDRVAALIVAGSNISLTYNDGAGTLTLAATGSGSAASAAARLANWRTLR
jgi:hypothetical protein